MGKALLHLGGIVSTAFLTVLILVSPMLTVPPRPFTGVRLVLLCILVSVSVFSHAKAFADATPMKVTDLGDDKFKVRM